MEMEKLPRAFYEQGTVTVAKELLGKRLVHVLNGEKLVVEITETEAYTGVEDKACHSYGGKRTARTEVMYLPGGHSYVYLIYGMYYLFNIVTEHRDNPCAVLVRGGKIISGHDTISRNRTGKPHIQLPPAQRNTLLDGPGKLCVGLGITKEQNGIDLLGDNLYLTKGTRPDPASICNGPRIGIDYAEEHANLPYRFYLK